MIPTRNRREVLELTLGTVLGQHGVSLSVVVVDEGSTDATPELLDALCARDSRVTVVRHDEPRGLPVARNAGLARVQTRWVAFCDDDDVWAPGKLSAQLAGMDADGAGWSCTGSVLVDADLRVIDQQRPPAPREAAALLRFGNPIPGGGSAVVASTELVRDLGGFDVALRSSEDWDLWVRLAMASPLSVVDRPMVGYRQWRGSMSTVVERMLSSRAEVLRRYSPDGTPPEADVEYERFLIRQLVRGGARLDPAIRYGKLALRHRRPAQLGRAVFALLSPALLDQRGTARALRRVAPGWMEEAESWLAPLRAGVPA